ncbi:MAG: heptose I phosphotransferase [Verrucomicrobiales bacterium]|jgi:heptose I phosphotransferase
MFLISLCSSLQGFFTEDARGFEELMKVEGKVFREVKGRRTVLFQSGGKRYFIKAHKTARISEWVKSLGSLKWPVLGARPEWLGIEALNKVGVPTMTLAGHGMRGWFPGSGGSFVITEAVEDSISLETLLERREEFGDVQRDRLKRHLIPQIGDLSRRLHEGGINHRDFYLCHFLTQDSDWSQWQASDDIDLTVIDLHRVQLRKGPTPNRWRVKDLGALVYSAFGAELTVSDAMRFIRAYYGESADWKQRYRKDRDFWYHVTGRALGFKREWDRQQAKKALAEM